MTTVRHPPGRAGRLWLRRRLSTAERGSEQLGRKLHVLLREQDRVQRTRTATEQAWVDAVDAARTWQLRAGILGGQQAYADGPTREPAQIETRWTSVVGVTVPTEARLLEATTSPPDVLRNAAVAVTADAFEAALHAAAQLAVAEEATRRIEVEIALTRRRVRALERRWLPALRAALADVEQSLELDEQEEGGRLRRALGQPARVGDRRTTEQ